MAQNKGTLIGTTVRPIESTDTFPTVLANEVMGGIHLVSTLSELNTTVIGVNRRQFGMMAFVQDTKRYYALLPKYPVASPEVANDANWTLLNFGEGGGLEWVDSVLARYTDSASLGGVNGSGQRITGNRFLVGTPSSGFDNKGNVIAVYDATANGNAGGFSYIEPTNGFTVRVDNEPGVIYTFVGNSSATGTWYKEKQNLIRQIAPTSADGLTYSYTTTSGLNPITSYQDYVYSAKFDLANTGTVSLSIDGNGFAPIVKVSSNTLVDLSSNDFGADIEYLLTYSNGNFQIFLPSGGGTTTIGQAEDGNYGDGLYTDFDENTLIGVPIDRFNQILKALVPPQAPNLKSWSSSLGVSGKISYTNAQAVSSPLNNYVPVTAPPSQIGDVGQAGSYLSGGNRLGIFAKSGSLSGTLNSDVDKNPNLPTAAYEDFAFGNGITGSVILSVNGTDIATADLGSTYSAINISNGDGSLSISSATSSKFSNGTPFETFWWRTGTWTINRAGGNIANGFNRIQVRHVTPSTTYTVTQKEFLIDDSTSATSYTSAGISSLQGLNLKYLSGIAYIKSLNFTYQVTVDNAYRNTYSADSDAITIGDTSTLENSGIYNGQSYPGNQGSADAFSPTTPTQALGNADSVAKQVTPSSVFTLQSGRRKIDGSVKITTTVKRTVQTTGSNTLTLSNWYIDSFADSSSNLGDSFDDEKYRLPVANYTSTSGIVINQWNSQSTLNNSNGLQIADGRLLYPKFNFSDKGAVERNPNFNNSNTNYTNCPNNVSGQVHSANSRTYIRFFDWGSVVKTNFKLSISSTNTNFVKVNSGLGGNNCYIEFKLPYKGSGTPDGPSVNTSTYGVTGWLDACLGFNNDAPIDGKGCLEGDVPTNYSSGNWKINFGLKSTLFSNGLVLVRITAGPNWNGYIESISLAP